MPEIDDAELRAFLEQAGWLPTYLAARVLVLARAGEMEHAREVAAELKALPESRTVGTTYASLHSGLLALLDLPNRAQFAEFTARIADVDRMVRRAAS